MISQATAEYDLLVAESTGLVGDELIAFWEEQLPYFCRDEYLGSTLRPTEIVRVKFGTFEYIFDHYSAFEALGIVPYSIWQEDRLVVVCGRSTKPMRPRNRDDARLRGV